MNTSRATVGIAIVFLAAALTLAGAPQTAGPPGPTYQGDPSVPPASEVFRARETSGAAQGNVQDMAY